MPDKVRLLIGKVADQAKENINNEPDLESELKKYNIVYLKPFFLAYPHAWWDLKRKLHKYRKVTKEKYSISKADEGEIYAIFLRYGREEDSGENITHAIPKEIFKNSELIEHASASMSLLDTSYLDIQKSENSISDKHAFIRLLIQKGLSENANISRADSHEKFPQLFQKVCKYLTSIYHINLSEMSISDDIGLDSLVDKVVENLWNPDNSSGNWLRAKSAWMIVKAFHAWWSIDHIINAQKQALEWVKKLPQMLISSGIQIITPQVHTDDDWNISFTGDILVALSNGDQQKAHTTYRVKSIESLLVKLWADVDYTNTDALRDMIGWAIHGDFWDNQSIKFELIQKISGLYANRWYLYKDKWWFGDKSDLSEKAYKGLKNARKKPLSQSRHRDAYSSDIVRNISLSGFMRYWDIPIGTEFQFFDTEDFNAWKKEHPEYHPRRILRAWARWQDFATPRQTITSYYKHRKPILNDVGLKSLINNQIKEGHIIPYFIEIDKYLQVIFALWKAEDKLMKRFSSAKIINTPLQDGDFMEFVHAICDNVSSSNPPSSSQLPSQD